MISKLLAMAFSLTAAGAAAASPRGDVMADLAPNLATEADRALYAALQHQRADERRVRFHAAEAERAERELAGVQVEREISLENRDKAVTSGDVEAAGTWAPRYAQALRDEIAAFTRVLHHRLARDLARADLERSEQVVRHAEALAQRDARS